MRFEMAPYRSVNPRVIEIWDEYEREHKKWLRKLRRVEKMLAEAQGAPKGERAAAWVRGKPNDDLHKVIGFQHLRQPREKDSFSLGKLCPIPPGWRHLAEDDYLTPIPENARRRGDDPNAPESVAARELMKSVQPPKTPAARLHAEFEMPVMVFGGAEDNHVYWPSMEVVEADGERVLLICWGTGHNVVSKTNGKKGWKGGGGFELIKPSEYYAMKGQ